MKMLVIHKIALKLAIVCCFISFFCLCKSCNNSQDVSGTVIAKSGDIKSRYKSTRIYTAYVFAIHPDDSRLSDFDIEVPLHTYIKFNVGDKVVFYDKNISKYLKDPKWYEKDKVWAIIFLVLLSAVCYCYCMIYIILKNNQS